MSNYEDQPKINQLYTENEQVNQALDMLNNGGNVMNFTVGPPLPQPVEPPAPGEPMPPPVPMPLMMPVQINIPNPPGPDPSVNEAAKTALQQRSTAIMQELSDLGVSDTPPAGTVRKPPSPFAPPPAPPAQPSGGQAKPQEGDKPAAPATRR